MLCVCEVFVLGNLLIQYPVLFTHTDAYVCEDLIVGEQLPTAPVPDRCSWDNGLTPAPVPSLNTSLGPVPICQNAVIDVYYNFTWKGQKIVMLNATIVLGQQY